MAITCRTLYSDAVTYSYGGGIYNVGNLMFFNTIITHSMRGDSVNNGAIYVDSTHILVMDGNWTASLDEYPLIGPLSN